MHLARDSATCMVNCKNALVQSRVGLTAAACGPGAAFVALAAASARGSRPGAGRAAGAGCGRNLCVPAGEGSLRAGLKAPSKRRSTGERPNSNARWPRPEGHGLRLVYRARPEWTAAHRARRGAVRPGESARQCACEPHAGARGTGEFYATRATASGLRRGAPGAAGARDLVGWRPRLCTQPARAVGGEDRRCWCRASTSRRWSAAPTR